MFVVKMKIKVLTEILPKILTVLTKNPSKMAFGRIFWKDWKDSKDSGNPDLNNIFYSLSMTVMASWAPGKARILAYWSTKETETPGTTWTPVGRQTHLMQNK